MYYEIDTMKTSRGIIHIGLLMIPLLIIVAVIVIPIYFKATGRDIPRLPWSQH